VPRQAVSFEEGASFNDDLRRENLVGLDAEPVTDFAFFI